MRRGPKKRYPLRTICFTGKIFARGRVRECLAIELLLKLDFSIITIARVHVTRTFNVKYNINNMSCCVNKQWMLLYQLIIAYNIIITHCDSHTIIVISICSYYPNVNSQQVTACNAQYKFEIHYDRLLLLYRCIK